MLRGDVCCCCCVMSRCIYRITRRPFRFNEAWVLTGVRHRYHLHDNHKYQGRMTGYSSLESSNGCTAPGTDTSYAILRLDVAITSIRAAETINIPRCRRRVGLPSGQPSRLHGDRVRPVIDTMYAVQTVLSECQLRKPASPAAAWYVM